VVKSSEWPGSLYHQDPALFLLDEPFSNLDSALREVSRQFEDPAEPVQHHHGVRDPRSSRGIDPADLLAIMDRGSIEQVGTYEEIYNRPRNVFVAGFLNRHIGALPISLIDADTWLSVGG